MKKLGGPVDDLQQAIGEVAALIARGMTRKKACQTVGCDLRGMRLPKATFYLPLPDEIVQRREEIKASWRPFERDRRRGTIEEPWTPSVVSVRDLGHG